MSAMQCAESECVAVWLLMRNGLWLGAARCEGREREAARERDEREERGRDCAAREAHICMVYIQFLVQSECRERVINIAFASVSRILVPPNFAHQAICVCAASTCGIYGKVVQFKVSPARGHT